MASKNFGAVEGGRMDKTNNLIGIIPARKGSQRLPNKNRNLLPYTLDAVSKCSYLHKVVFTSDDQYLKKMAWESGISLIRDRPAVLAGSESSPVDVILDAVDWLRYTHEIYADTVVLLQPTSPLRSAQDIDEAISLFRASDCDSLVSVSQVQQEPHCIIDEQGNCIQTKKSLYFFINGAIYITKVSFLREFRSFYIPGITQIYTMPKYRSIDVDDAEDWEMAEFILRGIEHG